MSLPVTLKGRMWRINFFRRILITLVRSATSLHLHKCVAWFVSDSWVSCCIGYENLVIYVRLMQKSLLNYYRKCSKILRCNFWEIEFSLGKFSTLPRKLNCLSDDFAVWIHELFHENLLNFFYRFMFWDSVTDAYASDCLMLVCWSLLFTESVISVLQKIKKCLWITFVCLLAIEWSNSEPFSYVLHNLRNIFCYHV